MYHIVILTGRLGRDPELRYTPNNQAVLNLNVATDRQWTDKAGDKHKETCWFRVTLWGKTAENANKYLQKGSPVLVQGRLNPDENGNPRTWVDKQGEVRTSFEMTADLIKYLPNPKANGGGSQNSDDIPFDLVPEDSDDWAKV